MAIKEDILFNAKFDDALKNLNKFSAQASSAFNTLGTIAKAAVAVFVGREFVQGIQTVTKAAAEQQQALQKMNVALALSGEYSEAASKGFKAFSEEMQNATGVQDDAILNGVALAKTFGTTNEQAQKLVKTAADLSAVTGMSLESSIESLGKTLQGTSGTLGKTIPGIKGLSEEALKAGEAIDIISKKFSGAAAANLNTFSGAITQLSNVFGDLQEEIGNAIVENPVVLAGIQALTKVFQDLTQIVIKNQKPLGDFVAGIVKFAFEAVPVAVKGVQLFGFGLSTLIDIILGAARAIVGLDRAILQLEGVKVVVDAIYRSFAFLGTGVAEVGLNIGKLLRNLPGLEDTGNAISQTFDDVANSLADAAISGLDFEKVDGAIGAVEETLKNVQDGAVDFTISFIQGTDKAIDYSQKLADSIQNVSTEQKKSTQIFEQLNSAAQGNKFQEGFKSLIGGLKEFGAGLISNLSVIGQTVAGITTGGFVNQFSDFVKQLGEAPKLFLEAFKNLDDIIKSLIENIPGFIDELVKSAPKIIEQITQAIPGLVDKFLEGFKQIARVLDQVGPQIVESLVAGISQIIEQLPEILDITIKTLPKVFSAILRQLPRLITAILSAIPQIIRSLAQVIPLLVSELAANIGPIVLALVQGILEAIPEIILVLIDEFIVKGGIFKIVGALIAAIPDIVIALVQGIVRAAYNSTGQLFQYLGSIFGKSFSSAIKFPKLDIGEARDFLSGKLFAEKVRENFGQIKDFLSGKLMSDRLKALFDKFQEQLKTILSGGLSGGKNGGLAKVGKSLGFATGGQVNEVPNGFPNDTFPARLTSGELVVDRSTATMLRDFLDNPNTNNQTTDINALVSALDRSSQKNLTVNIQVSDQELAKVILNLNRQGFRTA